MLKTTDFTLGLIIIGISFGMVVLYSLSSPFMIERVLGYSAITTGYSSLLSGFSLMTGGIIAKSLIKKSLTKKIVTAIVIQFFLILLMIVTSFYSKTSLYSLVSFVIGIHIAGGFIFNILYAYSLTRFSKNAGTASGVTGGIMYMISSLFSYGFANLFQVKSQLFLGVADLSLLTIIIILFIVFNRYRLKAPLE